jgi:hypothetical protein
VFRFRAVALRSDTHLLMLPRGPVGQIAHCVMVVTYTGAAII